MKLLTCLEWLKSRLARIDFLGDPMPSDLPMSYSTSRGAARGMPPRFNTLRIGARGHIRRARRFNKLRVVQWLRARQFSEQLALAS